MIPEKHPQKAVTVVLRRRYTRALRNSVCYVVTIPPMSGKKCLRHRRNTRDGKP
jgi:hypothetical protein